MSKKVPQVQNCVALADPADAARAAGLRYVTDNCSGIVRKRSGKAFRYVDQEGRVIRDCQTLTRVKSLAIPPAWKDV